MLAELVVAMAPPWCPTRSSPRSTPKAGWRGCAGTAPQPQLQLLLPQPAAVAAPAAGGNKGDVAMPAAAKLLADNNLSVGDVAGSGKDGRVTKGDVLAAVAMAAPSPLRSQRVIPTGVPTKALPQVAAPAAPNLGDRPEQRVPMTRLRARVAERLLQSQSTNAILTTFNEVNMAPGDGHAQEVPGRIHQGTRRQDRLHEASSSRRLCTPSRSSRC